MATLNGYGGNSLPVEVAGSGGEVAGDDCNARCGGWFGQRNDMGYLEVAGPELFLLDNC